MASLESLPDEVLKLVMQHIPLVERLTSCCLVSRRLHAAAVAATEQLEILGKSDHPIKVERAESILGWLSHYGQHVTSLNFSIFEKPLQQLPCPNLLELKLGWCSVQLGPTADGTPGVIQGCTKLTHLKLFCDIVDSPEGDVVDSLSSLVHLQQLTVMPLDLVNKRFYSTGGLSAATLPRLRHLTELWFRELSVDNLAQLGDVPLRALDLKACGNITVGPSSVPGLVFPESLTSLRLMSPVDGKVLALLPVGLQDLQLSRVVDSPDSFLSGVGRLQQLTCLDSSSWFGERWPALGPAYSALTASSKLVSLKLWGDAPAEVWAHVFPVTRKLPHLTYLCADSAYTEHIWPPSAWGLTDLCSLVSCCPNVRTIERMSLHPGLHVSELHKLTALSRFELYCYTTDREGAAASLRGLAAVTQLLVLNCMFFRVAVSKAALLPLTSLTALTSLEITSASDVEGETDDDEEDGEHGGAEVLRLKLVQDGRAPDVWLQLLEHCAADPECQPTALRSLAQQLAEQKALNAQKLSAQQQDTVHLQQQLAHQQHAATQQSARLQQQLSAQQQQIADLRQQLAAQQQAAAHQIAGLQQELSAQQQHIAGLQQQVAVQQHAAAEQTAGLQGQLQVLQAQLQELLQRQA